MSSRPGVDLDAKTSETSTTDSSLHTRQHTFTVEQQTSRNPFQRISSGKRAGDQLDEYIRTRSPSVTPPRSPTSHSPGSYSPFEPSTSTSSSTDTTPSPFFSVGVPHAALDQSLSNYQKSSSAMATRDGDKSSGNIPGQRSVESLLTKAPDAFESGSRGQASSMPLDAFRAQAGDWEKGYSGGEVDTASGRRSSFELEKEQANPSSDFVFHGVRAAVPQGGSGVGIGRLTTVDSMAPYANNNPSPRTSLNRIAENSSNTHGGEGSALFGPPSGNGRAVGGSAQEVSDVGDAPPESTLHQLTESLGFGQSGASDRTGQRQSDGWAGEKRAAASQLAQLGESQEETSESSQGVLSKATEALGLGGRGHDNNAGSSHQSLMEKASEAIGLGGSHHDHSPRSARSSQGILGKATEALGLGGDKTGAHSGGVSGAAATKLAQLGAAHERSRDPMTGDESEEKGLPTLTPAEREYVAYEDSTPGGTQYGARPELLDVDGRSTNDGSRRFGDVSRPSDDVSKYPGDVTKSPVSVLKQQGERKGVETERVYSDEQSEIWEAVGVGAAEGAGAGVALGAAAAVAALASPAVTAVAAGAGAGTLVGAGAAAAFGATKEVPKDATSASHHATSAPTERESVTGGRREIPLSEFSLQKDYPVVLPTTTDPAALAILEGEKKREIPLSDFNLEQHYLADERKRFEGERQPHHEGGEKKETVYSDKQSDIWAAVGKAAAGGIGVGAAIGAATTAVVAAPAVTAVAAGVGAGGLLGAGTAAAFGAKEEAPVEHESTGMRRRVGVAGEASAGYDGNMSPRENDAAIKIAGALAANAAHRSGDPTKQQHFGDIALQATAISGWAKRPGQDEAANDEDEARRANESARARAKQSASGTAPGEPWTVTVQKMLKRPEGTLFVLFAAMLAPYWLAAHIGLGAIGFLWQVFFGIITGIAAMLLYNELSLYRSRKRLLRAKDIAVLGIMDQDDLRKVMGEIPTHVSFPEFEKMKWLNKTLQRMWPHINKAASKLLEETITPILEMYKPVVLENMVIKKLNLGNVAPEVTGVRTRKGEEPGQVVLDVKLDWRRGKPNVYLDINPYLSPAITAKVKDVDVVCWVRLTFAPLTGKDFPCFGAIVLSLQEEPLIDFTIGIENTSIAVLPGLDGMIDNTIKTAVVDMLLWPSRMVFPILEGDYRDLEFLPTGVLTVTVIEATDLMKTDIIGKSDPFVFVYVRKLKERIKRTTTKNNDLNPVWNETFEVPVEAPDLQELTLRVMDEEAMANAEFIGMAKMPLRENKPGEVMDRWIDLVPESIIEQRRAGEKHVHERVRGRLHFRMRWDPYVKGQEPWRSADFNKQEEAKRKQMEEEERAQMKHKGKGKKGKK